MIVWGACVGRWGSAVDVMIPGVAANWSEGDVAVFTSAGTIAVAYNRILDAAPDGYRVVLLHDDTRLREGARQAIVDADADVAGPIGASGVTSTGWWQYAVSGQVDTDIGPLEGHPHGPVDVLDGLLLSLSPKATRLRFDEGYDGFHGYDADICFQARQAGMTVATAPIPVKHHTAGGYGDKAAWDRADRRWREKWLPG